MKSLGTRRFAAFVFGVTIAALVVITLAVLHIEGSVITSVGQSFLGAIAVNAGAGHFHDMRVRTSTVVPQPTEPPNPAGGL